MKLILRWLASTATLLLLAEYMVGIEVGNFYNALIAALVIGLLNALVRPVLVLLTLPITILTLGLFTFVINAVTFWFASTIVKGFEVSGFWPAFWGAIILWLVGWVANMLLKKE